MNREILFKAKTTPKESGEFNNVWVYGDLIHSDGKYYIHPKGNLVSVTGELGKIIVMHEVIPETICQYTGVKDKNGNRIFENNIVKLKFRGGRIGSTEREYNHVVRYDDVEASWEFEEREDLDLLGHPMLTQYNQHIYEVIGNIFDNPELVRGE